MLFWGRYMTDLPKGSFERLEAFQLHYSIGLSILLLSVLRLIWRVMNPAPKLIPTMKKYQKILAKGTHYLFYILLIALPLAGWATVSTSSLDVPIIFFDLFRWPWFPGVHDIESRKIIHEVFEEMHVTIGWLMLGLVVLHFLAALRHTFVLKDGALQRMWPGK
jgi:cytochrome b561